MSIFYVFLVILLVVIIMTTIAVVSGTKDESNLLYECKKCSRYFRFWQSELFSSKKGHDESIGQCPHCEVTGKKVYWLNGILSAPDFSQLIDIKEKPWLNYHLDCPYLTYKEAKRIINTVESIRLEKNDSQKITEWYEYNEMPNSDWLDRLQKSNKERLG